jgi:hypothetical protein
MTACMVYTLPKNWLTRLLKKVMLIQCEHSNYVIRMALGDRLDDFDRTEILRYDGLKGLRWGRRLDGSCDIDLFQYELDELENVTFNLDKAFLMEFWLREGNKT